ncbi:PdaC/SigV domain-containing protein [Paenibacillus sp. FSL K6-0108]|uniref:PdaC/SigV domain-containing protein n=1 Tax=Paenibacillus sp. FSL K6-0108 TaxID=2921417 RepID=UPI003250A9E1
MTSWKKWTSALLAAGIIVGSGAVWQDSSVQAASVSTKVTTPTEVTLKSGGKTLTQKGLLQGGSTWVSLTAVKDVAGGSLKYDAKAKEYALTAANNTMTISMIDGAPSVRINNYYPQFEAKLINGRLYVPFSAMRDYLGVQGSWDGKAKTLTLSKVKQNSVTVKAATVKVSIKNAEVDIQYPQVSGLANDKAEAAINKVLKDEANAFVADFKKQTKELGDAAANRPYAFESTYVVTYNENGVLGLVTQRYEDYAGAHGMTTRSGHTFALDSGKELSLDDVIQNNKTVRETVSKKVGDQLKARGGYLEGYKGLNKDQDFYVTPTGVVVFFQLYEYTAYAEGFPEFTFTYKELLPKGTAPFSGLTSSK